MAEIPADYIIQAAGEYDISGISLTTPYLLTLKGEDLTGATATISFNNGPAGAFFPVDDAELLGTTGITERRLQAPSSTMRIALSDALGSPLKVTLIEKRP